MRLEINVTEDDIKRGDRKSLYFCPIAIASKRLKNLTKKYNSISIGPRSFVGRLPNGDCVIIYLPPIARDFIKKFDNEKEVKPFSFEIEV